MQQPCFKVFDTPKKGLVGLMIRVVPYQEQKYSYREPIDVTDYLPALEDEFDFECRQQEYLRTGVLHTTCQRDYASAGLVFVARAPIWKAA